MKKEDRQTIIDTIVREIEAGGLKEWYRITDMLSDWKAQHNRVRESYHVAPAETARERREQDAENSMYEFFAAGPVAIEYASMSHSQEACPYVIMRDRLRAWIGGCEVRATFGDIEAMYSAAVDAFNFEWADVA